MATFPLFKMLKSFAMEEMNFQNGFQNWTKSFVKNQFPDAPRKLFQSGTICPVTQLRNILRQPLRF